MGDNETSSGISFGGGELSQVASELPDSSHNQY